MTQTTITRYYRKKKPTYVRKSPIASMTLSRKTKTKNKKKTIPLNRRKKQFKNYMPAGAELSYDRYKGGRRAKQNLRGAWKVLNSNKQRNIYFAEYLNRFMTNSSYPGYQQIKTAFAGSSATGAMSSLPLHLYSLSAAPQITNGSISKPTCGHVLQLSDAASTGYVKFLNLANNWDLQNVSGSSTGVQSFPGQIDNLKSVSIKLALFGSQTRATKYCIQLVQLRKPYLHPEFVNYQTNTSEQAAARVFYDQLTKDYSFSPVSFINSPSQKDIKVLKTWTKIIQPRLTTEQQDVIGELTAGGSTLGAMPHCELLNIYHIFNRTQRYNWSDNQTTAEPTGTSDTPPAQQLGDNRNDVTWNARVYLMVRALAPIIQYSDGFDSGACPSYDISIRTYHENLG